MMSGDDIENYKIFVIYIADRYLEAFNLKYLTCQTINRVYIPCYTLFLIWFINMLLLGNGYINLIYITVHIYIYH